MFKRFIRFMLLANGITPAGHREPDKWEKVREDRERWEREHSKSAPSDEVEQENGPLRRADARHLPR